MINRWFISCPGEYAAGILPMTATVELPMHSNVDPEYVELARSAIKDCFTTIWDDTRVSVVTDEELAKRDDAEKEYGP